MSIFEDIWKSTGVGNVWDHTGAGMLWKPLKKATGLTDAQMIGLGAAAVAAPYALPAMGAMGGAAGASTTGAASGSSLMSGLQAAGQVAGAANQAGLLTPQQMQAAPAQFQPGQGFAGLLTQVDQFDPEKRRKDQQMAMQGLLGGYRG